MTTLTKEDIRQAALKSGRYDLLGEEGQQRLESWVNVYYSWFRSDVWKLLPGKLALTRGPKVILNKVKGPRDQTPERFCKLVLEKLDAWSFVFFYGSGATHATIAFAKQVCFKTGRRPRHITLCDLFNWDVDNGVTLGTQPGDVLMLEIMGAGSGKLWFEKSMQILALLKSHRGPTILFCQEKVKPKTHDSELLKMIGDRFNSFQPSYCIEAKDG